MTKRLPLLGGLTVLALTIALTGCDPNKNSAATGTPPSSGGTSTSGASTAGSTPTTPTPTPTTAEAFNKPLKANGPVLIKIVTNGSSPFWESMGVGLKDALKTIGTADADPASGWIPPQGSDNTSQKTVFDQQIAAKADGLAVSTIQADAFAPVIDDAMSKGIPVITFDSDSPKSKRLAYIGTDNYQAGKIAGEETVKLFPNGGNFVAFVGTMNADNAKQRYNGFVDATKDHKITMLQAPFEDEQDQVGRAHRNVADAINKYGDKINGFLGLYSYNGPAIVTEVQKAGIRNKVKIVVFDGDQRTLDNLSKGLVDLAVVQKPYEFGRISALLLYGINRQGFDAAMKDLAPKLEKEGMKVDMDKHIIDTGVTVVKPSNAVEFIKALHAKGLQST